MNSTEKSILIISPWPELWSMGEGKGTSVVYHTVQAMLDHGYQLHIILPRNREASPSRHPSLVYHPVWDPFVYAPPDASGRIIHMITRLGVYWAFVIVALAKAILVARRERPSLVYGIWIQGAPVASIIGWLFRIPSIARLYGTFIRYQRLPANPIRHPWPYVKSLQEISAYKWPVTRLIVTDDGTQGNKLAAKLGVPQERLLFWRNGVDRPSLPPDYDRDRFRREQGIRPEQKLVLSASRLAQYKRVDRLIRVIPAVVAQDASYCFIILGDGRQRENLEKMAQDLGVGSYVQFMGAVSQSMVYEYMHAADIFVSLFDYSNVGNPLLEALRRGKAIVTLNVGATGEIISHRQNGMLLPPDDNEALVKALLEVGHDDALRSQLEQGALQWAEANLYTWEERMRMEINLLDELMAKGRKA